MSSPRDHFSSAPRDAPAILLIDIEPAMSALFDEWFSRDGFRVLQHARRRDERVATILIDLPFPRQDGGQRLRQLAGEWPGVPVIVLSSTFLPGVAAQGEVARALGASAVLATPVARETLRATVARLTEDQSA